MPEVQTQPGLSCLQLIAPWAARSPHVLSLVTPTRERPVVAASDAVPALELGIALGGVPLGQPPSDRSCLRSAPIPTQHGFLSP